MESYWRKSDAFLSEMNSCKSYKVSRVTALSTAHAPDDVTRRELQPEQAGTHAASEAGQQLS